MNESKLKTAAMDSVGELPNLLLREGGYPHLPTSPIKSVEISVEYEPELTEWISGYLKPVRDGVYERKYPCEPSRVFCKFYFGKWYRGKWTIDEANSEDEISEYQNDPWRGLAKEVQP